MQVILLKNVPDLGDMGDLVEVKPGFARNFLIPQRKAIPADPSNVRQIEHQRKLVERQRVKLKEVAKATAERLANTSITIARKVGEQEKLFGSVTSIDLEKALHDEGIELDRRQISLAEPIKALGVYQVPVKLDSDVAAELKVWVVAE